MPEKKLDVNEWPLELIREEVVKLRAKIDADKKASLARKLAKAREIITLLSAKRDVTPGPKE